MKILIRDPLAIAMSLCVLSACSQQRAQLAEEPLVEPEVQASEGSTHSTTGRGAEAVARPSLTDSEIAVPAVKSAGSVVHNPALVPGTPLAMKRADAGQFASESAYQDLQRSRSPLLDAVAGEVAADTSAEQYAAFDNHSTQSVRQQPLSTFGIDVDTASYTLARQSLNYGSLPRPESVRTEEWLNYFNYDYPAPENAETPFSVTVEVAPAPWAENRLMLSIGLKGYEVPKAMMQPLNLTFLIDVSGSMHAPNKLPLAVNALKMLTRQLRAEDRVAIVVYAGAAGLVLPSTSGSEQQTIIAALDRLRAGGSTAGGAGIELAYQTAQANHRKGVISRVVLLSDGDFNVGVQDTATLKRLVARKRASGVSLSVLTLGRGNIRDELMNTLAENGNGNAGYIDTAREAKKQLVDGMTGTLMTIAKDVKAQVEFNPSRVSEYRLLGYETRHLQNHEFNDDRRDAGEIGAGHQVTALYELTLTGSPAQLTPEYRYATNADPQSNEEGSVSELAFLKLRYKQPDGDQSTLITRPILAASIKELDHASANFRWSAAVAGAAQRARGITAMQDWRYSDSAKLARTALGADPAGLRSEFVQLLEVANQLESPQLTDAGR